ncbi:hypothetical protein MHYP_G00214530 [Metynnis hypsauchen]
MEIIKNAMDMIQIAIGEVPSYFVEIEYTNRRCLVPGDLLMRRMGHLKPYHAGIYCGNNDVIEFSGATGQKSSASCNMLKQTNKFGQVQKISVKNFANQQKLHVFRLESGAPKQLAGNIANAMDKEIPYDVMMFNCVHFALCILEVNPDTDLNTAFKLNIIEIFTKPFSSLQKKEWPSTSRSEDGAVPEDPAAGMLMMDLP